MAAGDEGDQGNGRLRVRVKQGKDDGSISGSVPGTALPPLSARRRTFEAVFCSRAGVFLPVGKDIAHILVNEKKLHEKL
jgi:hypothetical protein